MRQARDEADTESMEYRALRESEFQKKLAEVKNQKPLSIFYLVNSTHYSNRSHSTFKKQNRAAVIQVQMLSDLKKKPRLRSPTSREIVQRYLQML